MSRELVTELITFFSSAAPRLEFERVAGSGASGVALCFRDKQADPMRGEFTRYVVKTTLLGEREEIENEMGFLRRLRWAEHIITLLDLPSSTGQQSPNPILLHHPFMIIEYVENGTLDTLMNKCRAAGLKRLPNGLLWTIFLCLVRATIAMAYPPPPIPQPRTPRSKRRETLPENGGAPSDLIHADMNRGNLMFADKPPPNNPDTEHPHIPLLKLIDFGNALETQGPEGRLHAFLVRNYDGGLNLKQKKRDDRAVLGRIDRPNGNALDNLRSVATDLNTLEIGTVMARLLTNDFTNANTGVLRELMLELPTDPSFAALDKNLYWLVARCLACTADLRPRLAQLLDLVLWYAGTAVEEITEQELRFVNARLYDAEPRPARSGGVDDPIVLS